MTFVTRVIVGDRQRVIVSRKGRFDRILEPGAYTLFGFGIELEIHQVDQSCLSSRWTSFLLEERKELASTFFHVVETGTSEVALVSRNGRLERVQAPNERTLVWKTAAVFAVEHVDISANPIAPRALVPALTRLGAFSHCTFTLVDEGKAGLLLINGKFAELLAPGAYAAWNVSAQPVIELMDLRLQTLEVAGQEILTADKVSIRVNILAEFQVVDPLKARQAVKSPTEHLYKAVQLAVRQTLARRTLDEVLNARTDIDTTVADEVRSQAAGYGIKVGSIAVKDIIPPGEVREILNQVVAAEKKAQANLIARREEVAATRSLLNTAKLMAEHPLLVRMKELETLERVAGKVEKIHIHGGTEGLLQRLITINES